MAIPKRQEASQHPDRRLIQLCIEFAQERAAADVAFKIDPTGDNIFAGASQLARITRSREVLRSAAKIEPKTLDGFTAIMCVMDMILTAAHNCTLSSEESNFAIAATRHAWNFLRDCIGGNFNKFEVSQKAGGR